MNENSEKAIEQIKNFATDLDFSSHLSRDSDRSHLTLRRAHTTVYLVIENGKLILLYLYIRACEDGGRRTDLNECESILLATFLRISSLKVSCSLWDEPHPAIDMPEEIYARVMTINQFSEPIYVLNEDGIQQLEQLLSLICHFGVVLARYL